MGNLCSKNVEEDELDIGFDWWYLNSKRRWEALEKLVLVRPQTLSQEDPNGNLMLQQICGDSTAPQKLIIFIIDMNPSLLSKCDAQGRLPLHCACLSGRTEVIEMIMEGDKSAISARIAGNGNLPVHELLYNTNSIDLDLLLGLMLEFDSDVPNKKSSEGEYPLQMMQVQRVKENFIYFVTEESAKETYRNYPTILYWTCAKHARLIEPIFEFTQMPRRLTIRLENFQSTFCWRKPITMSCHCLSN
jgi:ankyrin repeat protein